MCKCSEVINGGYKEIIWECPQHRKTGSLEAQTIIHNYASKKGISYNEAWDIAYKNVSKFMKENG